MSELSERVRLRCVECGDCWIWQGWVSNNSPRIRVGGDAKSVRLLLYVDRYGRSPAVGRHAINKCESRLCVNPAHLEAQTISQISRRAERPMAWAAAAKTAATKREQAGKLTMETAQAIRASSESHRVEALKHGVSRSLVAQIRAGRRWKDYSNPFAGLMASNDSVRRAA